MKFATLQESLSTTDMVLGMFSFTVLVSLLGLVCLFFLAGKSWEVYYLVQIIWVKFIILHQVIIFPHTKPSNNPRILMKSAVMARNE